MKSTPVRLVVIEDESFDVRRIKNTLKPLDDKIRIERVFSNGLDALEYLETAQRTCDVIIMDYQISGGIYGEHLIRKIKQIDPGLQVIVITKRTIHQTDVHFANQLIENGACWFATKYPADIDEYIYQPTDFILTIMNAYERRKLEKEKKHTQSRLDRNIQTLLGKHTMVGESEAISEMRAMIERYQNSDANVLITGESGVGKELVALNIHYGSKRRYDNFVTVNCAALPDELVESELFGFTRGAFTGAVEGKPGLFEQANGGTIFLDEVSELPLAAQAKLLRVLEGGELDKIGRKKKYNVNVRVITATNRKLESLLPEKRFREDLFYRLNILNIRVPPLRERTADIPILIRYYVDYYCRDMGMRPPEIKKEAMKFLQEFPWPGNVRQLKNLVQRLLFHDTPEIDISLIKTCLNIKESKQFNPSVPLSPFEKILPLRHVETRFRREYVQYVRKQSRTDAEAADKLGIAPPNFHRMCKELGLK